MEVRRSGPALPPQDSGDHIYACSRLPAEERAPWSASRAQRYVIARSGALPFIDFGILEGAQAGVALPIGQGEKIDVLDRAGGIVLEVVDRRVDQLLDGVVHLGARRAGAEQGKQDRAAFRSSEFRRVGGFEGVADAVADVRDRPVAPADLALHCGRVEDPLDASLLELTGRGYDHGSRWHRRLSLHPLGQLLGDGVLLDVAGLGPLCSVITNDGRTRLLEEAGHLHVGVLGIDPDVDVPDLLQPAREDADARARRRAGRTCGAVRAGPASAAAPPSRAPRGFRTPGCRAPRA